MRSNKIRLLVTDVDGTLLDPEKRLSQATIEAIRELDKVGVQVSLASHRPLRGLEQLMHELGLQCFCAALNGGIIADVQGSIVTEKDLRPTVVQELVGTFERHHLSPWVRWSLSFVQKMADLKVDRCQRFWVWFCPCCVPKEQGLWEL